MKKVVNYTDGKKFKSKEEYLEHAKKVMDDKQKIKEALSEAVTIIYLDDSSDFGNALWNIVKILGGEKAVDLLQSSEKDAMTKYSIDNED